MEDYMELIYIGINILMFVCAFMLLKHKGYLTKKGENKALLENIREITKGQEEVKNELEKLKHNRISFDAKKRDVIIDFYSALNAYYNCVTYSFLRIYTTFDDEVNRRNSDKMQQYYDNFVKRMNDVFFFIWDADFHNKVFKKHKELFERMLAYQYRCDLLSEASWGNYPDSLTKRHKIAEAFNKDSKIDFEKSADDILEINKYLYDTLNEMSEKY